MAKTITEKKSGGSTRQQLIKRFKKEISMETTTVRNTTPVNITQGNEEEVSNVATINATATSLNQGVDVHISLNQGLDNRDGIMEFAIKEVESGYNFYKVLAGMVNNAAAASALNGLANEKLAQIDSLIGIKFEQQVEDEYRGVQDLKIADCITADVEPREGMSYRDALGTAIVRQTTVYRMYVNLAENAVAPESKDLFEAIARVEGKHKYRLETEYDNRVYRAN